MSFDQYLGNVFFVALLRKILNALLIIVNLTISDDEDIANLLFEVFANRN